MACRETHDVILLEPPEIFTAGVINLYTRGFYRDAAARLAPHGIMMQWLPHAEAPLDEERRLFRAFSDVFPYSTAWRQLEGGPIFFVGSLEPFTIDYQRLRTKMQEPRVHRDLELAGIEDVDHFLALFVFDPAAFREFGQAVPPVTDDRTVLDFTMPRYLGAGFGLGVMNREVQKDGNPTFTPVMERARYYYDHSVSVMPLLTDLGEAPETVAARIKAKSQFTPAQST